MADTLLSSSTKYEGVFDVEMLTIKLDEGETIDREIVVHLHGAAVLPYDPVRRVAMLISEARPAVLREGEPRLWEAIAGTLDDEPESCARREALEEGGLRLGTLDPVGLAWMTPPTSTERVHLFLARYAAADRVGEGGGLEDEQEHLKVREFPLAELWSDFQRGEVRDAKTILLLQALRISRPELF